MNKMTNSKKFTVVLIVFLMMSVSLIVFTQVAKPVYASGITKVQGPTRGVFAGQGVTTNFTVTLASTPASGDVLIAAIGVNDPTDLNTVFTVSQTGVTWTRQVSYQQKGNIGLDSEIWAGIVGSNAGVTITVTLTDIGTVLGEIVTSIPVTPQTDLDTNVLYAVADVAEYSGLATTSFLDQTATNFNSYSISTDTGTTATTSQSNELWVGAIASNGYGQSSPKNSFVLYDGQDTTYGSLAYLQNIVSATGKADSGTTLPSNAGWSGCIATFMSSSSSSSPSPSASPTATPTAAPTATPTAASTATPTAAPTATPTAAPTAIPTAVPTAVPTHAPSAGPTAGPTPTPTAPPTSTPTLTPTPTVPEFPSLAILVLFIAAVTASIVLTLKKQGKAEAQE